MSRLTFFACLVVAASTLGQTTGSSIKLELSSGERALVTPGKCGESVAGTWTVAVTGQVCSALVVWVVEGECTDEYPAGTARKVVEVDPSSLRFQQSGNFTFPVTDLPAFRGDAGVCGGLGREHQHRLCASFSAASYDCSQGKTWIRASGTPTIVYDSKPPEAPVLEEVSAQDRALAVRVAVSTDTAQVHFETRGAGEVDFVSRGAWSVPFSSARLEGLQNAVEYEVRAQAEDAAGNRSGYSNMLSETPVLTEGFFTIYRRGGGSEQGGCSAAAGGAVALLGLVPWFLRRRR